MSHNEIGALSAGSMAITFDFTVFLLTILRTYKWVKESRAHGINKSLHGLILRDGKCFPYLLG